MYLEALKAVKEDKNVNYLSDETYLLVDIALNSNEAAAHLTPGEDKSPEDILLPLTGRKEPLDKYSMISWHIVEEAMRKYADHVFVTYQPKNSEEEDVSKENELRSMGWDAGQQRWAWEQLSIREQADGIQIPPDKETYLASFIPEKP